MRDFYFEGVCSHATVLHLGSQPLHGCDLTYDKHSTATLESYCIQYRLLSHLLQHERVGLAGHSWALEENDRMASWYSKIMLE
jgi:hypothetical protein